MRAASPDPLSPGTALPSRPGRQLLKPPRPFAVHTLKTNPAYCVTHSNCGYPCDQPRHTNTPNQPLLHQGLIAVLH